MEILHEHHKVQLKTFVLFTIILKKFPNKFSYKPIRKYALYQKRYEVSESYQLTNKKENKVVNKEPRQNCITHILELFQTFT